MGKMKRIDEKIERIEDLTLKELKELNCSIINKKEEIKEIYKELIKKLDNLSDYPF